GAAGPIGPALGSGPPAPGAVPPAGPPVRRRRLRRALPWLPRGRCPVPAQVYGTGTEKDNGVPARPGPVEGGVNPAVGGSVADPESALIAPLHQKVQSAIFRLTTTLDRAAFAAASKDG